MVSNDIYKGNGQAMADGREERAEEEARREWERKRRGSADDEREYDGPEGDRERGGS